MRGSMSVPRISRRAFGDRRLSATAASVKGLGAVRAAGAPGADPAGLGQHGQDRSSASICHCSGLRQSEETLIVVRSRNSSSWVAVGAQELQVLGEVGDPAAAGERADAPLHLGALVLRGGSTSARGADALAEGDVVVGVRSCWRTLMRRSRPRSTIAAASCGARQDVVGQAGFHDRARHPVDGVQVDSASARITRPPRRRTSRAPSRPSLPMPVSTTSTSRSP